MADWSDNHSGQRVESLARFVALRHHDVRVGGLIPGLGSFNTDTHPSVISTNKNSKRRYFDRVRILYYIYNVFRHPVRWGGGFCA